MEYTQEMNLQSASGYCMPFTGKHEDVQLLKGYGEQEYGGFNHGIDLAANRYVLRAVADGVVAAIGSNDELGLYQTMRYGRYEVTYGYIANALVPFGIRVKAGSVVAISGGTLHIEVRYDGNEINPIEFLSMLYGNMRMTGQSGNSDSGFPDFDALEMDVPTDYDDDREEIEGLMMQYYPDYLMEVARGLYTVPDRTEQSLRNLFSLSALRNCFFERIPSTGNPLGVGCRSLPIAAKVQNLLIADFLNYLALRRQVFLSTMDAESKKKDMTKPPQQPAS